MTALAAIPNEIASVSTDQLRAELARGLALTADTLSRLGMIWAELERRGEDLSDLRKGIGRALPLIAAGRLAAEAVVAFAGRPAVLRAIEGLPLDRQRALSSGKELIEVGDGDNIDRVPLKSLPGSMLGVVFGDGEIRTPGQQRLLLTSRPTRTRRADEESRRFRPRYDRETGMVHVGPRMAIKLADLLHVLSAAAGPDHPPASDRKEDAVVIRVRVTDDEFQRMQSAAKKAGLPDWEMGRKALRAFGLI